MTGSTGGIGFGIASALAMAGAAIVLNGLGNPAEIDGLCRLLRAQHGVAVRHDGADMRCGNQIAP